MPTPAFELTRLDTNTFEHLANAIALRVLGAGHTGFGPGPDGGRDGVFQGRANYPSAVEQWDGVWYIQAKFLAPHLSKDPQKWLLDQIDTEISEYTKVGSRRRWPDNWIIVTNVDPSPTPSTGSFDQAKARIAVHNAELAERFAIWGGSKVLSFLHTFKEISDSYFDLLSLGHVLSALYRYLNDDNLTLSEIIRYLVISQFEDQQYTRLEQAGSNNDSRPGIHDLFVELPYRYQTLGKSRTVPVIESETLADLCRSSAKNQQCRSDLTIDDWRIWVQDPKRARVWFIKGGPGQGKSTLTQYFCQIQRASLMLGSDKLRFLPKLRALADEVRSKAAAADIWPASPRLPISIELKEYASWFGQRQSTDPRGVVAFLSSKFSARVSTSVNLSLIRQMLSRSRSAIIFDGLDEVPSDVKDDIAREVAYFSNDFLVKIDADALIVCTSRPQGYSGQFSAVDPALVTLSPLSPDRALACAKPVLAIARSQDEAEASYHLLEEALTSPSIKEIMQSPLQAHIMAVVVRDGDRPPEKKWNLFTHFYNTIRKREGNRNLPDRRLARLLRENDRLLKAVHNRLGFVYIRELRRVKEQQHPLRERN